MKILIDNREQKKLKFSHPYITNVIYTTLPYGDYGCLYENGYKAPYVFEKKALGDLYSSLSKGYTRLKRRMNQAIKDNVTFIIIIEASLTKINKGYKHSTRKPSEIIQQLFTLMVRHNIMFVCCKDAEEASLFITNFFMAVGRERMRKIKEDKKKEKVN